MLSSAKDLMKKLEQNGSGISPTMLMEQKAKEINELSGNLGFVNCSVCKNKGYIAVIRNDSLVMRECKCMARRKTLKRIKQSGLMDMLRGYTFAEYKTPEQWQKVAKEKAQEFVKEGSGKWFMIAGTPGTGKTHICTAIAGELIKANKEVRYMLWRSEAPHLKALVNERETYEREMRELREVDVLYIDDFFKGTVSDADINLAFEILNARYNARRLLTIISSEKTIEEILDIDEAIGSRIYERSKGFCIKTPAQNWRLK